MEKAEEIPSGVLKRPTQQDLLKRQNPVIEEGKKEFGNLIKDIMLGKYDRTE